MKTAMPNKHHTTSNVLLGNPQVGPGPKILQALKKETGFGLVAMAFCKKNWPDDPLRQIDEFFNNFQIVSATGRVRTTSLKTEISYRARLTTVVKKLSEMNMGLQNIDQISAKQVKLVFLQLEKEGWSSSWMANVNTTVRRFGIWIGKPDLCPRLPALLDDPKAAQRRMASIDPKNWEAKKIDIEMWFGKIELINPVTALQLRLAHAFGVRVQEFLMFRPLAAVHAGKLLVKDGTKGGRSRFVPIETEEQKDLLEQASELAALHPKGLLVAKKGLKLDQSVNLFYSHVNKAGVSRKDLGVTAHGLRHGYACRIYKQLTGEDPPVLSGGYVDPLLDKQARLEIADRLGHSRAVIVSAYIGSHLSFSKIKKENMNKLEQVLENDPDLISMCASGTFSKICVLGPMADGEIPKKGSFMAIGFEATCQEGKTQAESDTLALPAATELAARAGSLFEMMGVVTRLSWIVDDTMPAYELIKLTRAKPKAVAPVATNAAEVPS